MKVYSCLCVLAAFTSAISPSVAPAEDFDWRNVGGQCWMNPQVEDQGPTPDCYAFSINCMMELRAMLTRNDNTFVPDLSEQQWYCEETQNGRPSWDYVITHGIVSETEVPWTAAYPSGGWPLASGWENRVWKAAPGTIYNPGATSIQNVKNLLKKYGPWQIGMAGGADWWTPYDIAGGAHSPAIIGFHDDPNVPGGGYWIAKNSWGAGWNGDGYGTIAYADGGVSNLSWTFLTGPVYYTGPMYHTGGSYPGTSGTDYTGIAAVNIWKGATNGVWDTSVTTSTNWQNYQTGSPFQWVNHEIKAIFDSSGANRSITVNGKVIVHGMDITSTGYSIAANANSSLTVTSGGIAVNENALISSPLYIGGPQTWLITTGKTFTINGPLHTVISNTTIEGSGNVVISGAIDGGGYINSIADGGSQSTATGEKPGGIIKNSTGTLTLSGASNFAGDIAVNNGTLTLNASGGAPTYSGAFTGGGTINISSSYATSLGGDASNFFGTINIVGGNLTLIPKTGVTGTFSGPITGTAGPLVHNGPGTTKLTGTNTFTGATSILSGALQANSGAGLPSSSMLILNGGVLQGNGATTFSRTLSSTAGTNRFYWPAGSAGGGFSASTGTMNVRINNGTGAITWGTTQGSQLIGALMLSSESAAALTNFQNGLNLNGGTRTVRVTDNANSTADYAQISGVISGTGTSSILTKTGSGLLYLSGTNTYAGKTVISDGVLRANLGTGVPTNSNLSLNGGVFMPYSSTSFTRTMGTGGTNVQWTSATNGGGFAANTSNLTVNIGGSSGTLSWGSTAGTHIMGPLKFNSPNSTGTLTFTNGLNLNAGAREIQVNGSTATLSGAINGASGSSLKKTGPGKLVLSGTSGNTYSGVTTLLGGDVDLAKSSGYAIPGDLVLGGDSSYFVKFINSGQMPSTAKWTWSDTNTVGTYPVIELLGHNQTVAGISDRTYFGIIENTHLESGYQNSILTVNNSTDCFFNGYFRDSGAGSGTLGLTKTGSGTLTLARDRITHTGPTLVAGGTLVLQDTHLISSPITNNSSLVLKGSDFTWWCNSTISGTGSVTVTGAAAMAIKGSGSNTYTGGTIIDSTTLYLHKDAGLVAIPGNVTMTGTNSYLTLYQTSNNQIATNAVLSFNPAADNYSFVELAGNQQTLAGISDSTGRGVIENVQSASGYGNSLLTINNSTAYSFNGYLRDHPAGMGSGMLALTKQGTGTLTLAGTAAGNWANLCYTGPTTISGGKLVIQDSVNSFASAITNNASLELRSVATASSFGQPIGGTGSLTVSGAQYTWLTGSSPNTYTGGTIVDGGILLLNKDVGVVAIPGNVTMTGSNSYLSLVQASNNQIATNAVLSFNPAADNYCFVELAGNQQTLAGISDSTGRGVIENVQMAAGYGNSVLTINNSTAYSFNGYLRDHAIGLGSGTLALTKNGTGTLTLSGNNANDFTGGLIINAGTIDFENTENDVAHPYTINPGGHLVLNGVQLAAAASAMSLIAASETEECASAVPDTNNGTMSIVGSTNFNARNLVGTGTLMVKDDAVVYAHSLVQDTLVIGGTSSYSPAVAVPEPSTMSLLALAALTLVVGYVRRRV
jgi:autotransporter-associated beta strand protein